MSETKSVRANYIYNVIHQVLALLSPLITTPYLSRVLMADGIGKSSFVLSLASYFIIFAGMGIAIYGQREVSYFQDNRKERSRVFWNLKCLSFITTAIALCAYIIMSFLVAGDDLPVYLIMSTYILTQAVDTSWLFAGMENFRTLVGVAITARVFDIAFVFLFVKQKSDLVLHIGGMMTISLLAGLWFWRYVPEYIDKPDLKAIRPFEGIKTIWLLFIPTIATQIYTVLDKTMLGLFTDASFENGYYELAMRIARMALTLVTSLGAAMIPRIGYLFAQNNTEKVHEYMYRGYTFTWLLGVPLCLGLVGISDNFVPWFFGAGYEKISSLLKVSSFLIPAIGLHNATGVQYLIPTKREKLFTNTVIAGATLNFMLNIVLINMFLSYGAVLASVIAESFIAGLQLYIVRDELSFKKIFASGRNYYVSGIIMLLVLRYMNTRLSPSMAHTFMMIGSGAVIYGAMLLVLRDRFFIEYVQIVYEGVMRRVKGLIGRSR